MDRDRAAGFFLPSQSATQSPLATISAAVRLRGSGAGRPRPVSPPGPLRQAAPDREPHFRRGSQSRCQRVDRYRSHPPNRRREATGERPTDAILPAYRTQPPADSPVRKPARRCRCHTPSAKQLCSCQCPFDQQRARAATEIQNPVRGPGVREQDEGTGHRGIQRAAPVADPPPAHRKRPGVIRTSTSHPTPPRRTAQTQKQITGQRFARLGRNSFQIQLCCQLTTQARERGRIRASRT